MSKIKAKATLVLIFMTYMVIACVPVMAFVDLLRWLALPPGSGFVDAIWTGILDPGQALIIFALNIILIVVWAKYTRKFVDNRLMKGLRERAQEALKSKD